MLTLFHHPMFATCRFVRLAFGEYGEELALIEEKTVDAAQGVFGAEHRPGTLPILLAEGDVPIVGAMVIAEYLDETRGVLKRDKRLFAEDPMQRAEIRRLTDWYSQQGRERSDQASGARARAEAYHAGNGGRRLARFGGDPRGARQHPPAHEIHQLAGRHPPLAGWQQVTYADLAAAATLSSAGLSRRDRLARTYRCGANGTRGEIAAVV